MSNKCEKLSSGHEEAEERETCENDDYDILDDKKHHKSGNEGLGVLSTSTRYSPLAPSSSSSSPVSPSSIYRDTFSFSAAGWLQMYHFGVCKALQDAGITKYRQLRYAGSSAGSLASTAIVAECDFHDVRAYALEACADARRSWLNGLKIREYVSTGVRRFATEPFRKDPTLRERMEDQLEIFVTVLPWIRSKKLNKFADVYDLEEALIASCCVTPLAGMPFPLRKTGEIVIDGGLAAFQPRSGEPNVITVSPLYFSNCDIRPSVYIPALWGLYPPDPAHYERLFDVGYNDCLYFMVKTKRLPRRALKLLKNLDLPSSFHANPFAAQQQQPLRSASGHDEFSTKKKEGSKHREEDKSQKEADDLKESPSSSASSSYFPSRIKRMVLTAVKFALVTHPVTLARHTNQLCHMLIRASADFIVLLLFFIFVRIGALILIYCEMFLASWAAFAVASLQYVPFFGRRLRHRNYAQYIGRHSRQGGRRGGKGGQILPTVLSSGVGADVFTDDHSVGGGRLLVPYEVKKYLFPGESTDEDEGDFDSGSFLDENEENEELEGDDLNRNNNNGGRGYMPSTNNHRRVGGASSREAPQKKRNSRILNNSTAARGTTSQFCDGHHDEDDDDDIGETVVDYVRKQRTRMKQRARELRAEQKRREQDRERFFSKANSNDNGHLKQAAPKTGLDAAATVANNTRDDGDEGEEEEEEKEEDEDNKLRSTASDLDEGRTSGGALSLFKVCGEGHDPSSSSDRRVGEMVKNAAENEENAEENEAEDGIAFVNTEEAPRGRSSSTTANKSRKTTTAPTEVDALPSGRQSASQVLSSSKQPRSVSSPQNNTSLSNGNSGLSAQLRSANQIFSPLLSSSTSPLPYLPKRDLQAKSSRMKTLAAAGASTGGTAASAESKQKILTVSGSEEAPAFLLQQRRPTRRDTNRYTAALGLIIRNHIALAQRREENKKNCSNEKKSTRVVPTKRSNATNSEREEHRLVADLVDSLRIVIADALGFEFFRANNDKCNTCRTNEDDDRRDSSVPSSETLSSHDQQQSNRSQRGSGGRLFTLFSESACPSSSATSSPSLRASPPPPPLPTKTSSLVRTAEYKSPSQEENTTSSTQRPLRDWFVFQHEFERVLLGGGGDAAFAATAMMINDQNANAEKEEERKEAQEEEEEVDGNLLETLIFDIGSDISLSEEKAARTALRLLMKYCDSTCNDNCSNNNNNAGGEPYIDQKQILLASKRISQRSCSQLSMQVAADDALCKLVWHLLTTTPTVKTVTPTLTSKEDSTKPVLATQKDSVEEEETTGVSKPLLQARLATFINEKLPFYSGESKSQPTTSTTANGSSHPSHLFVHSQSPSKFGPYGFASLLFRFPDAFGLVFASNLEVHRVAWVEAYKVLTCVTPAGSFDVSSSSAAASSSQYMRSLRNGGSATLPFSTLSSAGQRQGEKGRETHRKLTTPTNSLSSPLLAKEPSSSLMATEGSKTNDEASSKARDESTSKSLSASSVLCSFAVRVYSYMASFVMSIAGVITRRRGNLYRYREAWLTWYETCRNLISLRVLLHLLFAGLFGEGKKKGKNNSGGGTKRKNTGSKGDRVRHSDGRDEKASAENTRIIGTNGEREKGSEGYQAADPPQHSSLSVLSSFLKQPNTTRLHNRSLFYRFLKPFLMRRGAGTNAIDSGSSSGEDEA